MRNIRVEEISNTVKKLCVDTNIILPGDVKKSLENCCRKEKNSLSKQVIKQIIENYKTAEKEKIPICQDTGIAIVFVELGQEIHIVGGSLYDAINKGVKRGYKEGYLRKSVVSDPLIRKNTFNNSPAIIYTDIVPGNKLKITVLPKGAGAENMSVLKMFSPSADISDIEKFVIDTVKNAWANPCPPIVVGIGIGGSFDNVTLLAKKALLRRIGSKHKDPFYGKIEKRLLAEINKLGIGPQGLGGNTTALDVFIETYPCHIASLPVGVNIQCHAARHKSIVI